MKNADPFVEYVKALNALPSEEKQKVVDQMTTAEALKVFKVALDLATGKI